MSFSHRVEMFASDVNPPSCKTDGCAPNCSFAYSCHDQRLGQVKPIAWPVVALIGIAVLSVFV